MKTMVDGGATFGYSASLHSSWCQLLTVYINYLHEGALNSARIHSWLIMEGEVEEEAKRSV